MPPKSTLLLPMPSKTAKYAPTLPRPIPKCCWCAAKGSTKPWPPAAPLRCATRKGRTINDQIVCPWHHACFGVDDGHLCQPPALDDLPTYPVRVADGRVWVTLPTRPAAAAESPDATPTALVGGAPPAPDCVAPDSRTFVIVGGGAAGQFAVQTLCAEGFGGRLVLVSADLAAPYDRTKLSKAFLAGKADKKALPLRQPDFYQQHRIEVLTDTRATGLNLKQSQLQLEGRDPLRYDKLLLAPGCQPNTLPQLPGHELAGVLPLRTAQDAARIREAAADAKHVIIIGSSFIDHGGCSQSGRRRRGAAQPDAAHYGACAR